MLTKVWVPKWQNQPQFPPLLYAMVPMTNFWMHVSSLATYFHRESKVWTQELMLILEGQQLGRVDILVQVCLPLVRRALGTDINSIWQNSLLDLCWWPKSMKTVVIIIITGTILELLSSQSILHYIPECCKDVCGESQPPSLVDKDLLPNPFVILLDKE